MIENKRVERHTSPNNLIRIEQETMDNVLRYGKNIDSINYRINQLEKEWDIERVLEMNTPTLGLIGLALGYFVHAYWFLLSALVMVFLFQNAYLGWCPLLPLLRRGGKRSRHEIEVEKNALKAIRGDYLNAINNPREAMVDALKH